MIYSVPVAVSGGATTIAWFKANLPTIYDAVEVFSDVANYVFTTPRAAGKVFRLYCTSYVIGLYIGDAWVAGALTNQYMVKNPKTVNPSACVLIISTSIFALVELYSSNYASVAFIGKMDNTDMIVGSVWRNDNTEGVIYDVVTALALKPIGIDGTITSTDGYYYMSDYYLRSGTALVGLIVGIKNIQMPQLLTTNYYQISGNDVIISGGKVNSNADTIPNNVIIIGGNI